MSDNFFGLPDDVTIPDTLTADATSDQADTVQMIPFPFCITYRGNPYKSITVAAPSPDLAATTIDGFVRLLNATLVQHGYPPDSLGWRSGNCDPPVS
jgi:hypothetical protein